MNKRIVPIALAMALAAPMVAAAAISGQQQAREESHDGSKASAQAAMKEEQQASGHSYDAKAPASKLKKEHGSGGMKLGDDSAQDNKDKSSNDEQALEPEEEDRADKR